jgi:hypothetical protein
MPAAQQEKFLPEKQMLEYAADALLGLVMIGCALYVTMSPEVEDTRKSKRPDSKKKNLEAPLASTLPPTANDKPPTTTDVNSTTTQ